MASYASPSDNSGSDYDFKTIPGQLVNSGLQGLKDLATKYKDNEVVGNLAVGGIADVSKTQANTGLAAAYNDAFLGSLHKFSAAQNENQATTAQQLASYQSGLESKRERETIDRADESKERGFQNQVNRIDQFSRRQFG
jgi:hypothetical protein